MWSQLHEQHKGHWSINHTYFQHSMVENRLCISFLEETALCLTSLVPLEPISESKDCHASQIIEHLAFTQSRYHLPNMLS